MTESFSFRVCPSQSSDPLPVLATFTSHRPPHEESAPLDVRVFKKQSKSGRQSVKEILAAETQSACYSGSNLAAPTKFYIGVYSKRKEELKICDVGGVFPLAQELKVGTAALKKRKETPEALNYAEKRQRLVDVFGSRKSKLALKQITANRVTESQLEAPEVIQQRVQIEAEKHKPVEEDTAGARPPEHSNFPPYDLLASTPEDIFPLDGIMPNEVRSGLDGTILSKADIAQINEWTTTKTFCPFVLQHLADFPNLAEKDKTRVGRMLLYLQSLIAVYHANPRLSMYSLTNECFIPPRVSSFILSTFADAQNSVEGKQSFMRTKSLTDKLLNYIIILALHIDALRIRDLSPLAASLNLTPVRLIVYCRNLGCQVDAVGQSFSVQISAPLKFPTNTKRAGPRNRK